MRGRRIPDSTRQKIADDCRDRNRTLQQIADKHGVSVHAVASIARASGLPGRPHGGYTEREDVTYRGGWVRDGLIWRPTPTTQRKAAR